MAPEVEKALEDLDRSGQTPLIVVCDNRIAGVLGARDRVRSVAHDVIHDLKHLGLKDLTILTGDRPAPALEVAKKVHIKQVEAEFDGDNLRFEFHLAPPLLALQAALPCNRRRRPMPATLQRQFQSIADGSFAAMVGKLSGWR